MNVLRHAEVEKEEPALEVSLSEGMWGYITCEKVGKVTTRGPGVGLGAWLHR